MSLHAYEIDPSETDWNKLLPLIDAGAKNGETVQAIFQIFSNGVEASRGDSKRDLKNHHEKSEAIIIVYRPFYKLQLYVEKDIISQPDQQLEIIKKDKPNKYLIITSPREAQDFCCLCTDAIYDTHFINGIQCIPLFRYNKEGSQSYNITDWALHLINNYYCQSEPSSPVCYAGSAELRDEFKLDIPAANPITKEAIFQYVYAVLHYPAYRRKHELNLKRESPRIPLYQDFHKWAAWGRRLVDLHINYETAAPYPLQRREITIEPQPHINLDKFYKSNLRAFKEDGKIEIDAYTTLSGVPQAAWEYIIGSQNALEWILDQYKETRPGDPIIAQKFNTHHFSNYKELVIDLLQRVCTVSVETMRIVGEMEE